MGDDDDRSPLHIVIKYLVDGKFERPIDGRGGTKHLPQDHVSPDEALERTLRSARTLKEAMLAHPGKVGFKDEDKAGFSPLDYAIEGDVRHEGLINVLLRRREPRKRGSSRNQRPGIPRVNLEARGYVPRGSGGSCARSVYSGASSVTEDQDMEILEQLEREEVEARRKRIEKIRAKRQQRRMTAVLFDAFGIEEEPPPLAHQPPPMQVICDDPSPIPEPPAQDAKSASKSRSSDRQRSMARSATSEEIMNRHLEDYLNGMHMDDFEGNFDEYEDDPYADDPDGFNIFDDPDEMDPEEVDPDAPPVTEIIVEDDDAVSVASEVTVPVASGM
jgi:hypothetical protein